MTGYINFVVVQLLSHVRLFVTPWTAAHQASLSFTISQSLLKLMSIESVMPSNHLILCVLSCGLYNPWNSPGQNAGVGSLSLLQGIFPTQELNRGLLHCRQILYWLSYQGSPSRHHLEPIIQSFYDWAQRSLKWISLGSTPSCTTDQLVILGKLLGLQPSLNESLHH